MACALTELLATHDVLVRELMVDSIDGADAWLIESHLTFDIPGLKAKGETAIVLVVATSLESSSLFYASVPDNASPSHLRDARTAMAGLRVDR